MQILTPSGYRDIATCNVGDEVSAFDLATGAAIVNTIETLQWVDATEWERWWQVEETTPPFRFFRINDRWTLNSEQSIWRNGTNVCHARDLIIGDVLHDGSDGDVTITSIETVTADGWWRFDISGDHSYIVDDLTLHNASRFWVGGTGTWDSSSTTHWASVTGGASGQSVPGSADTVTLDGSSGGGTVTVNFGGTITIQSVAMGAFTGTWDNSVNNNNMTLSATTGFNGSGIGTRSIKMGSATYTLSAGAAQLNFTTTSNLTLTANSSTITFSGTTTGNRSFFGGAQTFGTVNFGSCTSSAFIALTGGATFGTFGYTAPSYFQLGTGTYTLPAANYAGSAGSWLGFITASPGTQSTISASGSTFAWCSFRDINFTGSPTCSNCIDLGDNAGMTINAPNTTRSRIQSGF
jgi:hypothetical protein